MTKKPQPKLRDFVRLAAVCTIVSMACSPGDLLEVVDPDIIEPTAVNSAAGAAALYAGAIGDFAFGIVGNNGGQEGLIEVGGMITDEMIHSETFPTRLEYELRAIDDRNATLLAVFRQVQRARSSADAAVPLLRQYAPSPVSRVGEMFAISALTYTFIGEAYCSGVPFSTAYPEVTYGTPLTTTEIFTKAAALFDSALANAGGSAQILNLGAIGKGRALLNLGQFANAAAAVATVPLRYAYVTTHNTNSARQQNGVAVFNISSERWTLGDNEGINGLPFRTAGDPRVTSVRTAQEGCTPACAAGTDVGFDAQTPQYNQRKYPSASARLPIAQGLEAKLIIAEALLQAGNATAWLDTLNFLRDSAAAAWAGAVDSVAAVAGTPLARLTDPGTAVAREN